MGLRFATRPSVAAFRGIGFAVARATVVMLGGFGREVAKVSVVCNVSVVMRVRCVAVMSVAMLFLRWYVEASGAGLCCVLCFLLVDCGCVGWYDPRSFGPGHGRGSSKSSPRCVSSFQRRRRRAPTDERVGAARAYAFQ